MLSLTRAKSEATNPPQRGSRPNQKPRRRLNALLFPDVSIDPPLAGVFTLLLLVVFTVGMILVTSSVLVYLRDVRYVVPLAVQVGMFVSPVAYGLNVIPPHLRPAYSILNPLGPILDCFRRNVLHGQAPDWGLMGLAAIASLIWLAGGYRLFKRLEIGFADIA